MNFLLFQRIILTLHWSPESTSISKEDTWRHAWKFVMFVLHFTSVSLILNLFLKKKKKKIPSRLSSVLYCILHALYFTTFYKRWSPCCSGNMGLHQNEINWSWLEHKMLVCLVSVRFRKTVPGSCAFPPPLLVQLQAVSRSSANALWNYTCIVMISFSVASTVTSLYHPCFRDLHSESSFFIKMLLNVSKRANQKFTSFR